MRENNFVVVFNNLTNVDTSQFDDTLSNNPVFSSLNNTYVGPQAHAPQNRHATVDTETRCGGFLWVQLITLSGQVFWGRGIYMDLHSTLVKSYSHIHFSSSCV